MPYQDKSTNLSTAKGVEMDSKPTSRNWTYLVKSIISNDEYYDDHASVFKKSLTMMIIGDLGLDWDH